MNCLICDICGEKIDGDYKRVSHESTNFIPNSIFEPECDVCMKCWTAFTNMKRIPIVKFPNTEAEDGKN
jgi:hypothetical protein